MQQTRKPPKALEDAGAEIRGADLSFGFFSCGAIKEAVSAKCLWNQRSTTSCGMLPLCVTLGSRSCLLMDLAHPSWGRPSWFETPAGLMPCQQDRCGKHGL